MAAVTLSYIVAAPLGSLQAGVGAPLQIARAAGIIFAEVCFIRYVILAVKTSKKEKAAAQKSK